MQTRTSPRLSYGVQVAGVLATVVTALLLSGPASAHGWPVDGKQAEQALMALGIALVVGLRGVVRLDRSLG